MNYKFYTNSKRSWEAMYHAISIAKSSIYLEMYIFTDDMTEFNFLELLTQKAKNGVRVSMILDSYGSADLNKNSVNKLKNSGVEIFFISHFFHHTHRKILIVDELVAFIGGVNFHQSASNWNDLMVELNGKIVPFVLRSFAKAYEKCGGKDFFILKFRNSKKPLLKEMDSWLIEHSPMYRKSNLRKIYTKKINKTENTISLVTPYFMPKRWLSALLHQAVLKGIKVEVLVPRVTDYFLIDRMNYFFMYKLSKLGINIYLEKEMNHAKLMIIDDKEGMVGSQNLDFLSFDFNSEVGVFFNDTNEVKELVNIFEAWKSEAILFDYKTYKPNFLDYILSPFFSIFNWIF